MKNVQICSAAHFTSKVFQSKVPFTSVYLESWLSVVMYGLQTDVMNRDMQ